MTSGAGTTRHSGSDGRSNFAGLSGIERPGLRDDQPDWRELLALASLLAEYPDESLLADLPTIRAALAALADCQVRGRLLTFVDWLAIADLGLAQEAYVATFDQSRRHALYASYVVHGDTRGRGSALAGLKAVYRSQGFTPSPNNLPDYLPTMWRFAAQADRASADQVMGLAQPALAVLVAGLRAAGSPWVGLLTAPLDLMRPLDDATLTRVAQLIADGPPTETVGWDDASQLSRSGPPTRQADAPCSQEGNAHA
ncbi:MAG: nitrate reductase molybdenum cofactor assembly chaperone [Propionibacteriaceae bacterium]|jgi:nitrate reductase delta subunit|nr:nitrate reductase molybdenum cofactor assembly chaperone [Propionibacteriaceae bacterium]